MKKRGEALISPGRPDRGCREKKQESRFRGPSGRGIGPGRRAPRAERSGQGQQSGNFRDMKKTAGTRTMPVYRERPLERSEKLRLAGETVLLLAAVDLLFFASLPALIFLSPLALIYIRLRKKAMLEKRLKKLNYDFREVLDSLSVALRAGYSVENAFLEAEKNVRQTLGEGDMLKELSYLNRQVSLNVPPDELVSDLAYRTGLEDIRNFAAVFSSVRRMGGSMAETVRSAAAVITEKIDVEREIETAIAGKKTEQKIMALMPCLIILYMRLASPGFLDVLYTTALGRIIMTACLAAYAGAFYLGRRIVDIQV